MRIYQVEELTGRLDEPQVVCLGVFDGVHLGHRALIQEALRIAQEQGLSALVHTYDPPPFTVINPRAMAYVLTPLPERIALIQQLGIQQIAISRFTPQLQHQTGQVFFKQVLLGRLHARHLVVGFNHRFGYLGDTDIDVLRKLCLEAGIGLTVVQAVHTPQGNLISSTAIRQAILVEDDQLAAQMLGREPDPAMLARLLLEETTHPMSISTEGLTE